MASLFSEMIHPVLRMPLRLSVDVLRSCRNGRSTARLTHTSSGPLAGIRVLDLTRILAGPFCSMILGDMGAEVIKVEKPGSGDETRNWGPPFIGDQSCYFLSVNRNKKGIAIDLKQPEGVAVVKKLAESCHVFIENYMPGKLSSLGLGYEHIRAVAPGMVYCSISGYGSTGCYKGRAGYDVIAASMAGLLHITGPEGGDPCKVGVAMTDLATGLYAHGAILAALLHQRLTGKGQKIECNLFSSQVSLLVNVASNYLNAGHEGKRLGTSHESIVPYSAFKTRDGYLTVGAASNHQFAILCNVLGLKELLSESCFKDNESRVENRKKLTDVLQDRFKTKTTSEWLKLFQGSGIPYGPINSIKQVFDEPLAQEMVVKLQHETAGEISLVGPAVKFSGASNMVRSLPPRLGEHTEEVLSSILSSQKLCDLKAKKVIQ